MDSNFTSDSCSVTGPGWLAWLLFGIGALLEFTVLPGTLSFVLSFELFDQSPEVSTVPFQNCSSLRCGNGSDRFNVNEDYSRNLTYATESNFLEVVPEEQHRSKFELMIWLIGDLIYSVPKYTTRIFEFPIKRTKRASSMSQKPITLLSTSVTASLFHEQAKMWEKCRLKESF